MVRNYPFRYNDDGKNYLEVDVAFPTNEFYERCGIIPYYRDENGELFVILAVNRDRINQVVSFGGKSNPGEQWANCSLREFGEESYGLISSLNSKDILGGTHVFSQKCILSLVKINTIDEYYSFDLIKKLSESRYLENMRTKRHDQWETLTFERFTLEEFKALSFGTRVRGYELWQLDRIMLTQKWEKIVAAAFSR